MLTHFATPHPYTLLSSHKLDVYDIILRISYPTQY